MQCHSNYEMLFYAVFAINITQQYPKEYFLQFCFSKIFFPNKFTTFCRKNAIFLGVNLNLPVYGWKRVNYFCIFSFDMIFVAKIYQTKKTIELSGMPRS
jgi:hypothetical protein